MQACSSEKRMSCGFIDLGKNQFVYKLHTVAWYLCLLVYLEKDKIKEYCILHLVLSELYLMDASHILGFLFGLITIQIIVIFYNTKS